MRWKPVNPDLRAIAPTPPQTPTPLAKPQQARGGPGLRWHLPRSPFAFSAFCRIFEHQRPRQMAAVASARRHQACSDRGSHGRSNRMKLHSNTASAAGILSRREASSSSSSSLVLVVENRGAGVEDEGRRPGRGGWLRLGLCLLVAAMSAPAAGPY